MKIYLAGPMTGLSYEKIMERYNNDIKFLKDLGYKVFHPMIGKDHLKGAPVFKSEGYAHPTSTNHAIVERDRWMVKSADLLFVDLTGAERVSIGTMMEMAWAHDHGKLVILAMESENIHRHCFVLEAADTVFEKREDALKYLVELSEVQ